LFLFKLKHPIRHPPQSNRQHIKEHEQRVRNRQFFFNRQSSARKDDAWGSR